MFRKKNKRHIQPPLISEVSQLPERQFSRLEQSWAGVFYREVFSRLDENAFSCLYSDLPSRPNIPVNVLVGLEFMKSGFGWSDEQLYDEFLYNIQVRYALGYHELGVGEFDLPTLYNFRLRLSQYMQKEGLNLLEQAFEHITDEQLAKFQLKTGRQRMDSTQIASNIRQHGRLQLLVEVLQRVPRMLNEADQARYVELLKPFMQGHPGWYVYQMKQSEFPEHIRRVGWVMHQLWMELKANYAQRKEFQVLERVFSEHYRLEKSEVVPKAQKELGANSLQSLDDWEATIREVGSGLKQGYVANLAETCDPENPFQLITKIQVAPNSVDDGKLLLQALPNLAERTELKTLYTDGGYGGAELDRSLTDKGIAMLQTGIRGKKLRQDKLSFHDFILHQDETERPTHVTCPYGQIAPVEIGSQKKGYVVGFAVPICESCPFHQFNLCPTRFRKRKQMYGLYFMPSKMLLSLRRRRSQVFQKTKQNPRAAVEATIRAVKLPFPRGKLPVRGRFRMFYMMIGSAAINNVRQIQRYLSSKVKNMASDSFLSFVCWANFIRFGRFLLSYELGKPWFFQESLYSL
jgi:Transposase domain (DUF772)